MTTPNEDAPAPGDGTGEAPAPPASRPPVRRYLGLTGDPPLPPDEGGPPVPEPEPDPQPEYPPYRVVPVLVGLVRRPRYALGWIVAREPVRTTYLLIVAGYVLLMTGTFLASLLGLSGLEEMLGQGMLAGFLAGTVLLAAAGLIVMLLLVTVAAVLVNAMARVLGGRPERFRPVLAVTGHVLVLSLAASLVLGLAQSAAFLAGPTVGSLASLPLTALWWGVSAWLLVLSVLGVAEATGVRWPRALVAVLAAQVLALVFCLCLMLLTLGVLSGQVRFAP